MGPNEQLRPRHNGSNDITNTTPNSTQAVEGNQRANGQWQHVRRRRNRNQNRECLQNTNIIQQKESAAALVDVNEDTVQGENGNNAGAERVLNTTAEPITEGSNAGAERVLNTAAEPVTEGRNNEVVLENLANIAEVHNDPEVSERCLELVGAADVGAGPRNSPLSAQQHSQSQVNTLTFVQSDTLLTRPSTLSTESIPGTGMSGVENNQLQLMDQSIAFAGGIGINAAIVNDESGHRLNETPTDHQEITEGSQANSIIENVSGEMEMEQMSIIIEHNFSGNGIDGQNQQEASNSERNEPFVGGPVTPLPLPTSNGIILLGESDPVPESLAGIIAEVGLVTQRMDDFLRDNNKHTPTTKARNSVQGFCMGPRRSQRRR